MLRSLTLTVLTRYDSCSDPGKEDGTEGSWDAAGQEQLRCPGLSVQGSCTHGDVKSAGGGLRCIEEGENKELHLLHFAVPQRHCSASVGPWAEQRSYSCGIHAATSHPHVAANAAGAAARRAVGAERRRERAKLLRGPRRGLAHVVILGREIRSADRHRDGRLPECPCRGNAQRRFKVCEHRPRKTAGVASHRA